jgi:cytochrome c-type biogenesis protein CcmH/NrfF
MRSVTLFAALLLAAFLAGPGAAAAAEEAGWGYDMWNELMSPFCPGRTLADCPSGQAEQMRAWIVDQEEQGRTRTEVEAELYAEFGNVLRQAPAPEGVGLTAYIIPIAVFLAGGALVMLFLRRQTQQAAAPASPRVTVVDPELQRALDEEIGE